MINSGFSKTVLGFVLLQSACAWISAQGVPGGFHPDRQKLIVEHSKELSARLEKEAIHLRIVLQRGHEVLGRLPLPEEMAQVDSIDFAPNGKIAVLGHVNGSVRQVTVIDVASRTVIDKFYCYEPTLSPDKRLLAFVKFFPPHFVQGVTYQYLLYDFGKSPEANRPAGIPSDDPQNVGQVLYPPHAKNQFGDNTQQAPETIHTLASGKFFWSPTGKRVAFADSHAGIVHLVVAELRGATPTLRVVERELKKADICKPRRDLDSCTFVVSNIEFRGNSVTLALTPHSGEVKPKFQLQL